MGGFLGGCGRSFSRLALGQPFQRLPTGVGDVTMLDLALRAAGLDYVVLQCCEAGAERDQPSACVAGR